MAQELTEISSKRTDLLLEYGSSQTASTVSQDRKEELATQQQSAKEKIDILKKEISLDERELKGFSLFEKGCVTIHDEDASTILSEDGTKEYLVNKRDGTCKCFDHKHRGESGIICKHRIADKLARAVQNDLVIA